MSLDHNSKFLVRLRFVPKLQPRDLGDWVQQVHVGVTWWQAVFKFVQEFLQDDGGSDKASIVLSMPRCKASISLAAEMQQVKDKRRQPQQSHVYRPRVEIAALKK